MTALAGLPVLGLAKSAVREMPPESDKLKQKWPQKQSAGTPTNVGMLSQSLLSPLLLSSFLSYSPLPSSLHLPSPSIPHHSDP